MDLNMNIDELAEKGTVIFGTCNSGGRSFCFWVQKNSFSSISGLIEDIELNDFGYIANALDDSKCIPFGLGENQEEAYKNMRYKLDKNYDNDGNWISYDFSYGDFLKTASEIKGFVDFTEKHESELEKLILEYMDKNLAQPNFFDAVNIQEISVEEFKNLFC